MDSTKLSPSSIDNSVFFKDTVVSEKTKSHVQEMSKNSKPCNRQLMTRQLVVR